MKKIYEDVFVKNHDKYILAQALIEYSIFMSFMSFFWFFTEVGFFNSLLIYWALDYIISKYTGIQLTTLIMINLGLKKRDLKIKAGDRLKGLNLTVVRFSDDLNLYKVPSLVFVENKDKAVKSMKLGELQKIRESYVAERLKKFNNASLNSKTIKN